MPEIPSPYQKEYFRREDGSDDRSFYLQPRLLVHIDEHAIERFGLDPDALLIRVSGAGGLGRPCKGCRIDPPDKLGRSLHRHGRHGPHLSRRQHALRHGRAGPG